MFTKSTIAALFIVLFAQSGTLSAAPPTDEQVKAAVAEYQKDLKEPRPKDPRVAEVLKGISISEISVSQFELLGIMPDLAPTDLRKQFRERLAQLARQKDADGAVAAAQIARFIELPDATAVPNEPDTFNDDRVDSLIAAGDHPGFPAAIKAGRGTTVYYFMFFYAANERMVKNGLAKRLAALVDENWPTARLDDLLAFTEGIISPEAGLDRTTIDRVRDVATKIAQKAIAAPGTDEETRNGLLEAVSTINTAAARGQLVGNPAPAMHFLWTSTLSGPKSLDDFKGKVIVMDFWATWCGPCIAAFPHMRELQERYKESRVVLLGVTSLQGWILDAKAKDPAKRRLENLTPDDELKHLDSWVKNMNMTWTVGVSKENVFNRDYGVRGLATVVIIDAKGVVRHSGISPTDPKLEDMIDDLLREAGAEVPARK